MKGILNLEPGDRFTYHYGYGYRAGEVISGVDGVYYVKVYEDDGRPYETKQVVILKCPYVSQDFVYIGNKDEVKEEVKKEPEPKISPWKKWFNIFR